MSPERQNAQEYFKGLLLTVIGQAFRAAGYQLLNRPMQWAGGKFLFQKSLPDGLYGFIEFQNLPYSDTEWSMGAASRFRVTLTRSDNPSGMLTNHTQSIQRTLSALVVEDFGVAILPSAAHWWTYNDVDSLGKALAEAGHLIVGYGMPWLAGELQPPSG